MKMMKPAMAMMMICIIVLKSGEVANAAITCGTVSTTLSPCIPYLTSGAPLAPLCCAGIQSLIDMVSTTADRRAVCECLKAAAAIIPGVNYDLASALPSKCGISVPYTITPTTDCSTIS